MSLRYSNSSAFTSQAVQVLPEVLNLVEARLAFRSATYLQSSIKEDQVSQESLGKRTSTFKGLLVAVQSAFKEDKTHCLSIFAHQEVEFKEEWQQSYLGAFN